MAVVFVVMARTDLLRLVTGHLSIRSWSAGSEVIRAEQLSGLPRIQRMEVGVFRVCRLTGRLCFRTATLRSVYLHATSCRALEASSRVVLVAGRYRRPRPSMVSL